MTPAHSHAERSTHPEIGHLLIADADMPPVIPLLLYLSCASTLIAATGIGLSIFLTPAESQFSENVGQGPALAAAVPELEPPDANSPNRQPAWIAPTPIYDMPTPPIAKRAVENARKAAGERQRKTRAAQQRRLQTPESGQASSAFGFAGPPRLFFSPGIP